MSRSNKRRALRFFVFFALFVGAVAVAIALALRKRPRTGAAPPAGGVASIEPAGDGGLVENGRRFQLHTWSFALDRYEIRIEDAGMTSALDKVLEKLGAELVVNGGFFDPDGKPVGLAMSNGAILSRLSSKLSGGVLTYDGTKADLFPAEGFVVPDGGTFALQCRPRLVVERGANVKSDDGKRAERTALCTREQGKTLDVIVVRGSEDGEAPGPSLFALSNHLAAIGCEAALNLDGGPSTGAAWREGLGASEASGGPHQTGLGASEASGGPHQTGQGATRLLAPRGPVRHVIAFKAK